MESKIYIVGAHSRGQTFYEYISKLYKDTKVLAFLVDDLLENPSSIKGIPVLKIEKGLDTEVVVYLATRGVSHTHLILELKALGFLKIIPVDFELDIQLRNKYLKYIYEGQDREFNVFSVGEKNVYQDKNKKDNLPSACIYIATSVYDCELETEYNFLPEEKVIQVGTSLTDVRLNNAYVFDNYSDNISEKNKQFCELTAEYWIWKNAKQDIVGLVHYRRHFLLPDNWVQKMAYEKIDVILPVPLYVGPSLEENYKARHNADDWDIMMKFLKDNYPLDYKPAKEFFKKTLYSPCNMFIMRKEVLDEFAAWLFPILNAVVEQSGSRNDIYQNRYPGFLAERLMTYYFDKNRDRYNVIFANKNFLK